MNCKKCGLPVVNGAVFCSNCGARVDGNKVCPSCKNTIPDSSIFCACCGARVDGKTICSNCGKEIVGDFCSYCGTSANINVKTVYQNKKSFILNLISSICLIVAMIALFGFSFSFGTRVISLDEIGISSNGFLYYLFDCYSGFKNATFKTIFPFVLTTISICVHLVTVIISIIYSSVAFYKNYKDKNFSLALPFSLSLSTFVMVMISLILTFNLPSGNAQYLDDILISGYYSLNGGVIAGLIISLILGVLSFVLKAIDQGKSFISPSSISVKLITLISIIFALITLFISVQKNFSLFVQDEDEVNFSIFFSGYYDITFAEELYAYTRYYVKNFTLTVHSIHFVNFIISSITMISLTTTLGCLINSLLRKNNYVGSLVSASISTGASIVWLITSISCKVDVNFLIQRLYKGNHIWEGVIFNYSIPGPIICLVFSLIIFALVLTCKIITYKVNSK